MPIAIGRIAVPTSAPRHSKGASEASSTLLLMAIILRRWASCGRIDQRGWTRKITLTEVSASISYTVVVLRRPLGNWCDAPLVHLSHCALVVRATHSILVAGTGGAAPAFRTTLLG